MLSYQGDTGSMSDKRHYVKRVGMSNDQYLQVDARQHGMARDMLECRGGMGSPTRSGGTGAV